MYMIKLENISEFGVHLVELTLNRQETLLIRQLSSVLLKQYVEAHWCEDSEKVKLQKKFFSIYHPCINYIIFL